MDFQFLYQRIRYLITDPDRAWNIIHTQNLPVKYVRGSFFFPLIILVAIAAFTGSVIFNNPGLSIAYSILAAIKYFLLLGLVVYVSSLILRELTYALDLGRDFTVSFKLIVYSITPFILCQVISRLFESFIFINILAFYGLFIFWIGMEKMLNPADHKKIPLLILTAITVIGLIIVSNILFTRITDRIYFALFA